LVSAPGASVAAVKTIIRRASNGRMVLVAQNASDGAQAAVSLPLPATGVGSGPRTVLFEARTIASVQGAIVDSFSPWQRHLYELAAASGSPSPGTITESPPAGPTPPAAAPP